MLRVEVLNRVSEPAYLQLPDDDRARLFAGARDIVRDRISPEVIGGLGAVHRQRCELLRDDRPVELLAMTRQLADVGLSATVVHAAWDAGTLDLEVTAGLVFASSGEPVRFDDGGSGQDPQDARETTVRPYAVNGDPGQTRIQLVVRSRPSVLDWYVKAPGEPFRDRVGAAVHARIDPMRVGAGATPMDRGQWDVLARVSGLGIERSVALRSDHAVGSIAPRPALVGAPARIVVPVLDAEGLHLEIDPPSALLAGALGGRQIRLIRDGDRLAFDLPIASGRATATMAAALVVGAPNGGRVLAARLVPRRGGVVLELAVDELVDLAEGRYPVGLRLGAPSDLADVPLGTGVLEGGRLRIGGLERLSVLAKVRSDARWVTDRAASAIDRARRRIGRGIKRRLRR